MGKHDVYTDDRVSFILENYKSISRQELTERFNTRFGTNKSVKAITSWCNSRGLNNDSDGKFKDGHVSWQTGLKGDEYKSHFTEESFNRSISGIMNKRAHAIGDELVRDGVPMILVSVEPNVNIWDRCVPKRRYVWEQAYGPIPPKHKIIHLDGDCMNCNLDNLYCIPFKYTGILNRNRWMTDSREHTLAAIKWCELFYAMKDKRGEK